MNFGELKDFAVSLLDDLDFGYFTEVQVGRWINMGQRKLQRQLVAAGQAFYFKCANATLVANECGLLLPDDFQAIHKVSLITGGVSPNEDILTIDSVTLNEADLLDRNPGQPIAYYLHKNTLKFVPVSDTTYPVRLTYSYAVADMVNDNDVPDAPERYHELIGIYGAKYGYVKDDRDMIQLEKMETEYLADLKRDAQQRMKQKARRIVQTGYDDWGGEVF